MTNKKLENKIKTVLKNELGSLIATDRYDRGDTDIEVHTAIEEELKRLTIVIMNIIEEKK